MNLLLDAFIFFLPAGIANLSPVFASRLPILRGWKTPIDMGKSVDGHRILGDNKTWRGIVFGSFMGAVTAGILTLILDSSQYLTEALVIGAIMGFGALAGDAVESFFKRRRGIKPGNAWFPFDQTDYIIGGLLCVAPLVRLSPQFIIAIFVIYFGLHLVTSYIGYKVGLKDKPI